MTWPIVFLHYYELANSNSPQKKFDNVEVPLYEDLDSAQSLHNCLHEFSTGLRIIHKVVHNKILY